MSLPHDHKFTPAAATGPAVGADRRLTLLTMLFVAVAMVLGGGGSPAPLPELALQVFACAALVWAVFLGGVPAPHAGRAPWIIAAALLAVPLLQLIPLPPAAWHALPGRESQRAALALIGDEWSWRPLSVAPARTLASLLAMITPAVLLLLVAGLPRAGRAAAIGMVAGVALMSLLVGVAQMAGGEANAFRFYVPDGRYLNGFQANHNSAADVLLIGMVAFAAVVRELSERRTRRASAARPAYNLAIVAGGTLLFSLGVFFTASRAGTALLPVAWIAVAALVRPWVRWSRRRAVWAGIGALAAAIAVVAVLMANGTVGRVIGRYDFANEFRPQLWRDTLFAIGQYLPLGSGMGSFVPVFIAAERLEVVDATLPNRAHNDYLELMLEAGVLGAVAFTAISAVLARQLRSHFRTGGTARAHVIFAIAALAIIGLHSLVDYPLRSMSLACIAALAAGVLMRCGATSRVESQMLERTTEKQT